MLGRKKAAIARIVTERLTLDDGHDGALLDSRRALETIGVDTTKELGLQVHRVKGVGRLIVVGLNRACCSKVSLGAFFVSVLSSYDG